MRDKFGVPLEPEEQPSVIVAYDWCNLPIYSDDNNEYICYEGEYILDDAGEMRAFLLENGYIVTTMGIYNMNKYKL